MKSGFLKLEKSPDQSQDKYNMQLVVVSVEKEPFSFKSEKSSLLGASLSRVLQYVCATLKAHPVEDTGEPCQFYLSANEEIIKLFNHDLNKKRQEDNSASSAIRVTPLIGLQGLFDGKYQEKCHLFEAQLGLIAEKVVSLRRRGYEAVADKAQNFHTFVSDAANLYFQNPTVEQYQDFRNKVNKAYIEASPDLGTHRGYKQLLGNVLLAILGLGVFYGIAVWINGGLFFKTDSMEKVDSLIAISNNLAP